jgi:hypothetical protein
MATIARPVGFAALLFAGAALAADPVPTASVNATLAEMRGTVLVNQGERFEAGSTGTLLKKNDRVMAMEESDATVKYFEGCEIKVKAGTVVTIPELIPCECGDFSDERGPVGRIAEATGTIQLEQGEVNYVIAAGQTVAVGDLLRAGVESRAVVEFRDGCRSEVAAGGEYRIPDRSPCACGAVLAQQVGPAGGVSDQTLARILIPIVSIIPIFFPDDDDDVPVSP